jgi:predicted RNA-binding Zn ribbon-like protein
MQRARDLRWAIYRIFAAVAAGREIEPLPLATLNAELGPALSHATLVPAGSGVVWGWSGSETALDAPLWTVARAAAELLTAPELGRVRECAGPTCSWLFVDASRNGSRRFCSPTSCGNRDRVRRFYARRRRNVTAPGDRSGDEGFPAAETSG